MATTCDECGEHWSNHGPRCLTPEDLIIIQWALWDYAHNMRRAARTYATLGDPLGTSMAEILVDEAKQAEAVVKRLGLGLNS